ncbi:hypothetical protein [Flavisphingomonas formosensis]|uniref:hypothetical protein n=1 Tax=Flavisphingomonas formosensis TaxID=861534 RepID=UPI0012F8CB9E|nr:hypothetical protein [Sphingomonas formosensis]
MRHFLSATLCALLMAATAHAQTPFYRAQDNAPPKVPLWELEANGDAVQKDMGFVFPTKWRTFERRQFTSTRQDGASVKVWYESPDKALTLGILLQLRVDVRGVDFGADLPWTMITMAADVEQASGNIPKPTVLSSAPFMLGDREPAGKMRWARYNLPSETRVQGLWWQNIGLWSVVITVGGPESRKAEVEEAAAALFQEMPFPRAPVTAELFASGKRLFANMPGCEGAMKDGAGSGGEKSATAADAMAISITLPRHFNVKSRPASPAIEGAEYCLLERFEVGTEQISAIRYMGKGRGLWDSRYGFAVNEGRNGYFQFDRPSSWPKGGNAPVILTYGNSKAIMANAIFTDWPSYADAKKMVVTEREKSTTIATATNPARNIRINVNKALMEKAKETPEPVQK